MLRNKCIMVSILCVSGLIRGAATYGMKAGKDAGRLQLSDCFTQETTPVSGSQRFYEPIIVGRLLDSKTMRGVIGFVEGKDAALTKQAAELITTGFESGRMDYLLGRCYSSICLKAKEWAKCIIGGDITQLHKIVKTRCVLTVMQSKQDARYPQIINLTITNASERMFGDIIVAQNVHTKLKKVESCYDERASMQEKLTVLARYAATLSVSHDAAMLKFDRERYAQFLKQEFNEIEP